MLIKNFPKYLQPREKAEVYGIATLSNSELLALFIRTGNKKTNVLDIANMLLARFHDISQLSKATFSEVQSIAGIGKVKAIEILALFEIAKRINNKWLRIILTTENAIETARELFPNYYQEHFVIIVLSKKNELIYKTKIASGHEDAINISPKIIFAEILKRDGVSFYCFHNHPSENPNPSSDDLHMTESLIYYSELLGIKFCGHFIITRYEYQKISIEG